MVMNRQLRYLPAAVVIGGFLAVSFAACVAWDAIFPDWAMRSAWAPLLPGFTWLSVGTFLLGLVEAFAYGFWVALVVPAARWMNRRLVDGSEGLQADPT
jgi:hypothetical protein